MIINWNLDVIIAFLGVNVTTAVNIKYDHVLINSVHNNMFN